MIVPAVLVVADTVRPGTVNRLVFDLATAACALVFCGMVDWSRRQSRRS